MLQRDGDPGRPKIPVVRGKNRIRKTLSIWMTGLAIGLVRLICATIRVRCIDEERFTGPAGGKILCLWHGRTIPAMARYRGEDITIMISLSRDGDIIAKILAALGFPALRGSTGPSGARVLAGGIKLLRSGKTLAVTPDGPRGPSGVLQGGVMAMARKSGAILVPLGSSARPRVVMKSWDRYAMPLPFSRALMVFGEPVVVPEGADDATVEDLRLRLEREMKRVQDEADRGLGVETFAEIGVRQGR